MTNACETSNRKSLSRPIRRTCSRPTGKPTVTQALCSILLHVVELGVGGSEVYQHSKIIFKKQGDGVCPVSNAFQDIGIQVHLGHDLYLSVLCDVTVVTI